MHVQRTPCLDHNPQSPALLHRVPGAWPYYAYEPVHMITACNSRFYLDATSWALRPRLPCLPCHLPVFATWSCLIGHAKPTTFQQSCTCCQPCFCCAMLLVPEATVSLKAAIRQQPELPHASLMRCYRASTIGWQSQLLAASSLNAVMGAPGMAAAGSTGWGAAATAALSLAMCTASDSTCHVTVHHHTASLMLIKSINTTCSSSTYSHILRSAKRRMSHMAQCRGSVFVGR